MKIQDTKRQRTCPRNTREVACSHSEPTKIYCPTVCRREKGRRGIRPQSPAELNDNCRRVAVAFEKFDSGEIDLLDCCHIYGVYGGFTVAEQVASGK